MLGGMIHSVHTAAATVVARNGQSNETVANAGRQAFEQIGNLQAQMDVVYNVLADDFDDVVQKRHGDFDFFVLAAEGECLCKIENRSQITFSLSLSLSGIGRSEKQGSRGVRSAILMLCKGLRLYL